MPRPTPPRRPSPLHESVKRLEEKIAYLERHVTEQDRAMLEMADDIARLRKELFKLRERAMTGSPEGQAEPADERPPHY
jgi:SlyX protein